MLFPGQNSYQIAQASWQPAQVQGVQLETLKSAPYPYNATGIEAPFLTAKSALVMDRDSGVVIYEKNFHLRLLPASTVKIMTALVALDHYNLDDVLVVPSVSDEGQDMKLMVGEQITVRNLVYGLLISSANDAALTLAYHYPGGQLAFIQAMNAKAETLHLDDSFFANPTGLDEEGLLLIPPSHSSTLDLARLSVEALKNPVFAQIVGTPKIVVTDVAGKIVHELFNINELLFYLEGVKGVKTGWTENAEECLVAYTEREGRGVVTVVLGSLDRFDETRALIEWTFANHQWQLSLPPT